MAITLSGRVEGTVNNGLARQGVSSNFVPFHSSDTSNPFPKNIHLQHIKYAEGAINNHHDSLHNGCSNRPYCRLVHLTEAVSFPRHRPLHLWSLRGGATASRRIHPRHIPCTFIRHAVGGMLTFSYSQSTAGDLQRFISWVAAVQAAVSNRGARHQGQPSCSRRNIQVLMRHRPSP